MNMENIMKETIARNILSLSPADAKAFLLKEESYSTFELPLYFTFSKLLSSLSQELNGKSLSNYCNESLRPSDFEDVNYQLMNNKNGKYSWRLFELIHPAIYVSLVHIITSNENWTIIKEKFNKKRCVECMSIPIVSQREQSDKAEQVTHWWEAIEQRSVALALEYEYIFHTDISDCYGSIYTHSIAWALHGKDEMKKKENRGNKKFIGNLIDCHIRAMSHGQTNGIPQGSVLMDFIAEMVLSYADELLAQKLSGTNYDYRILRYRDDYRIFVNNPQRGEEIIKYLTEILAGLGMQLNAQKTLCSNDIIRDSIKPDKFYSLVSGKTSEDMQEELFNIKHLSELFPNSGCLDKRLQNLHGKIWKNKIWKKEVKKFNPEVLISIVTDLAFNNPRTYPVASGILSEMIGCLQDEQLRKDLIIKIKNKFKKIPNTEHMDLWLQRITLKPFREITYEGRLCRLVAGDASIAVWNSDWLEGKLAEIISSEIIINVDEVEKLNPIIQPEEIRLFDYL